MEDVNIWLYLLWIPSFKNQENRTITVNTLTPHARPHPSSHKQAVSTDYGAVNGFAGGLHMFMFNIVP